jgi:hypothetical protein
MFTKEKINSQNHFNFTMLMISINVWTDTVFASVYGVSSKTLFNGRIL